MSQRKGAFVGLATVLAMLLFCRPSTAADADPEPLAKRYGKVPLDVVPKPVATDRSVRIDYDIVYVRAPRFVKDPGGHERPAAGPRSGIRRRSTPVTTWCFCIPTAPRRCWSRRQRFGGRSVRLASTPNGSTTPSSTIRPAASGAAEPTSTRSTSRAARSSA